jgi:hypothetical protein
MAEDFLGNLPNEDYAGDADTDPTPSTFEDEQPLATIAPQRYYEQSHGEKGIRAGDVSAKSRHVTWSLCARGDRGNVKAAFGFHLNPQAITRTHSGRSQLQATRARFYVDDFGPGPTTITVRQLVASGKHVRSADSRWVRLENARQNIMRFLAEIYYPAMASPDSLMVYWQDHHLNRGGDELVYFPSNGVEVARDVSQHGVWMVGITMVSLERKPYKDWPAPEEDSRDPEAKAESRVYIVKRGQTKVSTLVRALMRTKYRTVKNERKLTERLLSLNPDLKRKRTERVYGADGKYLRSVTVGPYRLAVGQRIRIPVRV